MAGIVSYGQLHRVRTVGDLQTGIRTPMGNPKSKRLYRFPAPKRCFGPKVPQKTAPVKKVVCPGPIQNSVP